MWVENASAQVEQDSSIRSYNCAFRPRRLGVDDWAIFVSAALTVTYTKLAIRQARLGLGLPVASRPTEDTYEFTQLNYAGRPIYIAALASFKIALCCETLRMIQITSETTLRVVIKGTVVFVSLSHVAIALALMLYCRPVRKAWNPHIQGKCISPGPLFYGTASVSIVCDLIAFSMPFAVLYPRRNINRDIPRLIVLLFFGFLTTICSIVRMLQIRTVVQNGDSTMLILWGVIEACIGVITSSIPTFNGMISALLKPRTARSDSSRDTDEYRELPGTGSEVDGSIKLNNITCTTDIRVTNIKMKKNQQVTITRPEWEQGRPGIAQ
ncbi:hypothetical protein KCU64_g710, partial [Aureobasidium melanogenum]